MIPVIGVPVVSNPYWIHRMISSIDYPVENVVIINNNGRGQIDEELDSLVKMSHDFVKKIKVVHMPANIGVAGAFNLVIKCYMNAQYWVMVNDDIMFNPGCLAEIAQSFEDPDVGLVHPNKGDFDLGSWDCFAIHENIIKQFGLFDENTYPAYCEDADYIMRMVNRNVKKIIGLNNTFRHGHCEAHEYYNDNAGGQTKKSDSELFDILENANVTNFTYLTEKWGPGWRTVAPTHLPWEGQEHHITETRYDLEFVRTKHTGF